ncbi:AsmA family protein [Aestuariivirga sp.]|uniref:AsmA family protein n=1 Tax=Aestuariivirga sp. TaxID=2650926 RepID=UPI0025BEFCA2|nr:AsmA family protein [Aestuariivirga sp.]MCA3556313.1 AsmA family protein [Aestuariivirga sp.]
MWKSPVLYFGILLVMLVAGLLAAPFVIDWNSYRADLEAYGRKLTGRGVVIDGPVSARLFPWPRLTIENLRVGSPESMDARDFASARRLTVNMTLQGLLQGGIDVESIAIEQPELTMERLETGEGNWMLEPSADLVNSDILSRVRLDRIALTGGTVKFRDRRRDETVTLDGIDADVASPGVAGPWRLRAGAVYNGTPVNIALNTAAYVKGQPFLFGVKLQAADNSGGVYSFDGSYKDGLAQGSVQVSSAQREGGGGDAGGQFRPLIFTARASGNLDRVDFTDIELARDDPADATAIATGSASLSFGRHIDAVADLSASVLDLDELAGARSRDVLRQAGSIAVIDGLLALLPQDMSLGGSVRVTSLRSGGQSFDNVELVIAADRDRLSIKRLASGLPGRSDMLFRGSYFTAPGGGELSGDLGLEVNDLREFTLWLWPGLKEGLAPLWTGSRGRLKLQTGLSLAPQGLRLTGSQFELDGEPGKGSLAVTSAGRGAVDVDAESGRFDLDAYAPQGIPAIQAAAQQGADGLLGALLPRPDAPDLRLMVKAGELAMNGVTARDVTLDLQSGANGMDLRTLSIGAVGGASVAASGLILDNGKGADGSISLDIKAGDPGELIRLMGLAGAAGLPPWAQNPGATVLRADLGVNPGKGGSVITLKAGGTAGPLTLAASGSVAPDNSFTGTAKIDAAASRPVLALIGLAPLGQDALPASIALAARGRMAAGFDATATLQALGGRLDYEGAFDPLAEGFGINGKLALRATDAAPLFAASGLPVADYAGGVLVGDAALGWADGKWTLAEINGRLGAAPFSGAASLTPAMVLDARLDTGTLRLGDLMAATFLDWSGPGGGLETGFATALPFGLTGQLWLTPASLDVHRHFTARSASVGIAAKPGEIHLAMLGKDEGGRGAQLDLTSTGTAESRVLSGKMRMPVDLARQLALAAGGPVAAGVGEVDLTFRSEGRSPAAALAAAQGQGQFALEGFTLPGVTPAAFTTALNAAKDASAIAAAFAAMRQGPGLAFGAVSGIIGLAGGEMTFATVQHVDDDAGVYVKTVADLAQGEIDMEVGVSLKARPNLPRMSVAYAGPPLALVRSEDNSEIATSLGVSLMQQGISELERLQQEQLRLAREEERQRAEDEARLQAYYAQRDELLLRKRELKVQGEMQVMAADRLRRQIEAERAANAEINKQEMRQRMREIRTWRRTADARGSRPVFGQNNDAAPTRPSPNIRKPPKPGPVILANPPGAPVIISPPPDKAFSQ